MNPVLTQHYAMLKRNLLYTRVTRGKRLVVLVGEMKEVAVAVRNASGRRHWSKLDEWLAGPTDGAEFGFLGRAGAARGPTLTRAVPCGQLPGHVRHGPGPCPKADFISLWSGIGAELPSGAEGSQRCLDY